MTAAPILNIVAAVAPDTWSVFEKVGCITKYSLNATLKRWKEEARAWLDRPVDHPRDVRSELLIKLALRDRKGADASELLRQQRDQLAPIAAVLSDRLEDATGFERTLALWRSESISATLRFLEASGQLTSSAEAAKTR